MHLVTHDDVTCVDKKMFSLNSFTLCNKHKQSNNAHSCVLTVCKWTRHCFAGHKKHGNSLSKTSNCLFINDFKKMHKRITMLKCIETSHDLMNLLKIICNSQGSLSNKNCSLSVKILCTLMTQPNLTLPKPYPSSNRFSLIER
jgi:hypothetical protein